MSLAVRRASTNLVSPTSLKLPLALKREIGVLSVERGISPHAFMLEALSDTAERARLREKFQTDSLEALRGMRETGKGYALESVREYFRKLALYRRGKGPKPRRPAPVKVD